MGILTVTLCFGVKKGMLPVTLCFGVKKGMLPVALWLGYIIFHVHLSTNLPRQSFLSHRRSQLAVSRRTCFFTVDFSEGNQL